MIYTQDDNHPLVKLLKTKGWVIFDVTSARATERNGICAGWWIDCYQAFGTKHQETHRVINKRFLGITLKDALLEVKNDNFPTNNKSYCLNVIHHTCQHFGISGCNKCEIKNYQRKI